MKIKGRVGFLGGMARRASCLLPHRAKNTLNKGLYQYLARRAEEHQDLRFWNFGFADPASDGKRVLLNNSDEKHRYCIQLYDHIAGSVDLKGLDVLEVGCGCGGGASFLMKRYLPRSFRGVDLAESAIAFCNRHHAIPGLSFSCASAESLPFENDNFDTVISLESSHCYSSLANFLNEVHRVLRSTGYFLFADFRRKDQMDPLRGQLEKAGFRLLKGEIITPFVLQAMDLDHERKMNLLNKKAPKLLLNSLKYWWGTTDSKRYELFRSGKEIYFNYVLNKRTLSVLSL